MAAQGPYPPNLCLSYSDSFPGISFYKALGLTSSFTLYIQFTKELIFKIYPEYDHFSP